MEWYQTVHLFVRATFPNLRKTRQKNLAFLTYGILKKEASVPLLLLVPSLLRQAITTERNASTDSLIIQGCVPYA